MSTSINFDSENFGKLFIRSFLGIFFIVKGVHCFANGRTALTTLGTTFSLIGVHFSPLLFGAVLAILHITCGLAIVIGFFFKLSCFLLGAISLLGTIAAGFPSKSIINSSTYMFTISMVTTGMMFIGSGRFSVKK
ncbi:MAG: DoxX family membrane protein [Puniceicoccales bacterium]|nr:DoxX family membrane protein [Puniceicoccales bacterium]